MILWAFVLAALLAQGERPRFTSEGPASIEGIVVVAGTSQPIAGATMELTGIAPRTVEGSSNVARGVISVSVRESETDGRVLSFTAITRSDGTFEFSNVPPGPNYQLIAIHFPEYLAAQYGQRVPSVPGRAIDLGPGERLKALRIEMTPAANISGVVVDSRGQPMRNVPVELRRPWYFEGWRLLVDWNQVIGRVRGVGKSNRAARSVTNIRGEFAFSGLAPAQYYIRTSFTDEENEEPINLHAGATISNLQIISPVSRRQTITGTVIGENGRFEPSARLTLYRLNAAPIDATTQIADFEERGQFAFSVPSPGKYALIAEGGGRSSHSRAYKEIAVSDSDLNVIVQLVAPFSIPGGVTYEGNPPAEDRQSGPMLVSLYPTAAGVEKVATARLPSGNGSFILEDVTIGPYRVEVSPILKTPPNLFVPPSLERAYVKSVRLAGRDVLNGGLRLESPTNGPIEVVISANGGSLSGQVLDSRGKPVPHVITVLVPNAPRRSRGDLYKYVATDDVGRYQLNGVAPGDYKLFAWERVEEGAWQDPQFLKLFEALGSAVRISEGSRGTADTKLILAWN